MTDTASTGAIETVKDDIGTEPADKVRRWKQEIELAEKAVKKWHKAGEEVVKRYRDEEGSKNSRFNVLWSNTETLKPAIYGQPPTPDVRRRITDPAKPDPVGRAAAMVLERGLSFSIDDYDFDGVMNQCVEDYLLPGRGTARVRYIPTMAMGEPPRMPLEVVQDFDEFGEATSRFMLGQVSVSPDLVQQGEDGQPYMLGEAVEEVVYEEASCEYVFWQDRLESPARIWEEVRWVGYRSRLSRQELRDQFPGVGDKVTLDWAPGEFTTKDAGDIPEFFKKATVWEIWDKDSKKVIAIAKGYDEAPLKEWDDPLELEGFFPEPRPLDFVTTTSSRIPIPVYKVYQDQAEELNVVTQRINKLISMLKVRGVFDKVEGAIEHILNKPDGTLVGVENFAELVEKGGLDRVISFLPIEQIANVLQGLYLQRDQIKRTIHEITGLSDIVRGSTDPRETKGAQQLKAEFSSLRLQNPQRKVQRYARDLLRIKAEVIAEHFGDDMLRQISGLDLPSEEQKAAAQQQVKAAAQQGQPPGKDIQQMLGKPTWDEVTALLRDDGARGFRIDIETDSTIQIDEGKAKQESVEMIQAVTSFIKESAVVAQQSPALAPFMMQLLKLGLRSFKPGRLVEEAMDEAMAQLEQAGPAPQPGQAEAAEKAKAEQEKQQAEAEKQQAEAAKQAREQQQDEAKAQAEGRKQDHEARRLDFEERKHQDDMAQRREDGDHTKKMERGKFEMEQDKIMGEFGPNIIEALERAQANLSEGSRGTQEAMVMASQQNTQAITAAVQALVVATEALGAAIQTIGGPKRIVKTAKGEPIGIEPGVPNGTTLQ